MSAKEPKQTKQRTFTMSVSPEDLVIFREAATKGGLSISELLLRGGMRIVREINAKQEVTCSK